MKTKSLPLMPGESSRRKLAPMLRVDHAGEYGAQRIYAGQLAVLGDGRHGDTLRHMAAQEDVHLKAFENLLPQEHVRPTALLPLWHMLGYAIGYGTARLGERAAMACTVAVEEVIVEHYAEQIEALGRDNPEVVKLLDKFKAEEDEHREIGLENEAELAPLYRVLRGAIRRASKTAIWLSERV